MSNLTKDELGFIRVSRYGRMGRKELEDWMELQPGEAVYHSGVKRGVRVSEPVKGQDVKLKPGDTLSVGPVITKAASTNEPEWLRRERQALSRAGYGGVGKTVRTRWGWALLLKGLTLPGGIRTEALVLLPKDYPRMSPIGFYIRDRAAQGGLDLGHLFARRTYHGAMDLSEHGWKWFCGVVDGGRWVPGRHNLVSYVSIVLSLFNERGAR